VSGLVEQIGSLVVLTVIALLVVGALSLIFGG